MGSYRLQISLEQETMTRQRDNGREGWVRFRERERDTAGWASLYKHSMRFHPGTELAAKAKHPTAGSSE